MNNKKKVMFSNRRKIIFIVGLLVALLLVVMGVVTIGSYYTSIADLFAGHIPDNTKTIILNIRLPRIVLAMIIGMALGSSGTIYQGIFGNPLIEPYILGVSSGSAFGASIAMLFHEFSFSVQITAFAFGLIAVTCAYFLARVRGKTPLVTLILSGVVVSSVFSAFVSVFQYLSSNEELRTIVFWLMGGLYHAAWSDFLTVAPGILISLLSVWIMSWKLNVISMGTEEAKSLGIHVERTKIIFIVIATFMTSLSVSVCGIIGWIGLLMPHAGRLIIGPDHRFLIPASAIMGALFLILCDTIARTITTAELPIGIITSIAGAPFIIYLIRTSKKVFWQ